MEELRNEISFFPLPFLLRFFFFNVSSNFFSDVSHTLLLIIELLLPAFLPSQAGIGVLQPRPSSKLYCGREHAY